jgi:hypothetical protein
VATMLDAGEWVAALRAQYQAEADNPPYQETNNGQEDQSIQATRPVAARRS